jgi:sugar/nucleoside kinase (ribokinase family)
VPETSHRDFDVVVLGDCNPDLVLSGDDVVPQFGQVERLVDGAELTIGGSGGIMAAGAARLGLRTALVGVTGDDLFGSFMRDALAQRGVDTEAIVVDASARTGLTVILSRPGDRAILTFPGSIAALSADGAIPELITRARHVHVASYFLQTSLIPGLIKLFQQARHGGTTTSVDPNWDPAEHWDGGLREVLAVTDLFLPNAGDDPADAARALARLGPMVVVKLGAEGALAASTAGELVRVPSPVGTEPVDTVGAGDSFDAGVLAGLLSGSTIERALALGCACGALSTRAVGGTTAQPTLEEALAA